MHIASGRDTPPTRLRSSRTRGAVSPNPQTQRCRLFAPRLRPGPAASLRRDRQPGGQSCCRDHQPPHSRLPMRPEEYRRSRDPQTIAASSPGESAIHQQTGVPSGADRHSLIQTPKGGPDGPFSGRAPARPRTAKSPARRAGSQAQSRRAQSPHPPTDPGRRPHRQGRPPRARTQRPLRRLACRCAMAPAIPSNSANGRRSAAAPLPARPDWPKRARKQSCSPFPPPSAVMRQPHCAASASASTSSCSTGKGSPVSTRPRRSPRAARRHRAAGRHCRVPCPSVQQPAPGYGSRRRVTLRRRDMPARHHPITASRTALPCVLSPCSSAPCCWVPRPPHTLIRSPICAGRPRRSRAALIRTLTTF